MTMSQVFIKSTALLVFLGRRHCNRKGFLDSFPYHVLRRSKFLDRCLFRERGDMLFLCTASAYQGQGCPLLPLSLLFTWAPWKNGCQMSTFGKVQLNRYESLGR